MKTGRSQHLAVAILTYVALVPGVFGATALKPLEFSIVAQEALANTLGAPTPFEFAAADIDLDGDLDLLVNWHLSGLQLHLNSNNADFTAVDQQSSGLYQEGNVFLYGKRPDMIAQSQSSPGIYLWHDPGPLGSWNIYINPASEQTESVKLALRSNEIIGQFQGVEETEVVRDDTLQTREDAWALLQLRPGNLPRHITFRTKFIGSNIKLTNSSSLPFYLGATQVKRTDPEISLRKPDPHAMAWVNTVASPHPDLFVARGGNRGRLLPPFQAKRNRLFTATGDAQQPFTLRGDAQIPQDYGRGRSVAWVDINGDQVNELYIGNKTSSNALLMLDKDSGQYEDMASRFGLSMHCADAFTWLDLNGDGFDDLLFSTCFGSMALAMNHSGQRFSIHNAEDYGITLGTIANQAELFQSTALHSVDFDADGDLDILISGLGKRQGLKLFRNVDGKFLDATSESGLATVNAKICIATDLDEDGFIDLVTSGRKGLQIYRNIAGGTFSKAEQRIQENDRTMPTTISTMAAADLSGSDATDIVLGSKGFWTLLQQGGTASGKTRRVTLQRSDGFEPVGTVVRAHYKSGRVLAQRYGSAGMNGISQFVFPLAFGVPDDDAITHFTYAAPGSSQWRQVESSLIQ